MLQGLLYSVDYVASRAFSIIDMFCSKGKWNLLQIALYVGAWWSVHVHSLKSKIAYNNKLMIS